MHLCMWRPSLHIDRVCMHADTRFYLWVYIYVYMSACMDMVSVNVDLEVSTCIWMNAYVYIVIFGK